MFVPNASRRRLECRFGLGQLLPRDVAVDALQRLTQVALPLLLLPLPLARLGGAPLRFTRRALVVIRQQLLQLTADRGHPRMRRRELLEPFDGLRRCTCELVARRRDGLVGPFVLAGPDRAPHLDHPGPQIGELGAGLDGVVGGLELLLGLVDLLGVQTRFDRRACQGQIAAERVARRACSVRVRSASSSSRAWSRATCSSSSCRMRFSRAIAEDATGRVNRVAGTPPRASQIAGIQQFVAAVKCSWMSAFSFRSSSSAIRCCSRVSSRSACATASLFGS